MLSLINNSESANINSLPKNIFKNIKGEERVYLDYTHANNGAGTYLMELVRPGTTAAELKQRINNSKKL